MTTGKFARAAKTFNDSSAKGCKKLVRPAVSAASSKIFPHRSLLLDRFDEHIGANSFPGEFQLREDSRNRGRLLLGDEAVGKLVQVIGLPGKVGCENLTAARNCFAEGVGSAA